MKRNKKEKIIEKWDKKTKSIFFEKLSEFSLNASIHIDVNVLLSGLSLEDDSFEYGNLIVKYFKRYGCIVSQIDDFSDKLTISELKKEVRNSDISYFICINEDSIAGAIELLNDIELKKKIWIFYPIEKKTGIAYQILASNYGFNKEDNLFSLTRMKKYDVELILKILIHTLDYRGDKKKKELIKNLNEMEDASIFIAIITALPKELKAVKSLIEDLQLYKKNRPGANKLYFIGKIPTVNNSFHNVALTWSNVGNNMAAIRATNLIHDIPSVKSIIMVGIAGGVPYPANVEEHVRLGDVVVSSEKGVIQYDFMKAMSMEDLNLISIDNLIRPSAELLEIAVMLQSMSDSDEPPWKDYISIGCTKMKTLRPSLELDILKCSIPEEKIIPHPFDDCRRHNLPKIFLGPIATGNSVLKDEKYRDYLRDTYRIKAVEMESSGIRDATWILGKSFIVIRGICDYCNIYKNDIWQNYAAIVAASFARSLIEMI